MLSRGPDTPDPEARLIEIFVDADACPVKDEVYVVATRYGVPVAVVANTRIGVPQGLGVEMVVVDRGPDAADDWIVDHVHPADVVVTADFSHFTNVAENDMRKPPYSDMMDIAIERADHIHARVGSSEAPQVADPRVGSGLKWTELFESWWDRIVEARLAEGRQWLTVNAEFGPPPYQPAHPDGAPLSDIWDVCLWTSDRFRDRWQGRCAIAGRG
jgi:hypothetical protein